MTRSLSQPFRVGERNDVFGSAKSELLSGELMWKSPLSNTCSSSRSSSSNGEDLQLQQGVRSLDSLFPLSSLKNNSDPRVNFSAYRSNSLVLSSKVSTFFDMPKVPTFSSVFSNCASSMFSGVPLIFDADFFRLVFAINF